MKQERLDKIIATQFNVSRRDARIAIRRGKVKVGGKTVRDFGLLTNIDSEISFDGQALNYKEHIYILMNKPKGVLSASSDKNKKTVVDLVPENLRRPTLFPAGRLDRDTTGLLIITDDGDELELWYHDDGILLHLDDGLLSKKMIDVITKIKPSILCIQD